MQEHPDRVNSGGGKRGDTASGQLPVCLMIRWIKLILDVL